jgi:hypothetical protein
MSNVIEYKDTTHTVPNKQNTSMCEHIDERVITKLTHKELHDSITRLAIPQPWPLGDMFRAQMCIDP